MSEHDPAVTVWEQVLTPNLVERTGSSPFPSPETVDILAEVSDFLTRCHPAGLNSGVIRSLASFAGAGTDPKRGRHVTAADERGAMVHLAAHAVARIQRIDSSEVIV